MSTIKITLSAANMGPESTEEDFDAWTAYVNEHIDEALGITTEVEQAGFTGRTAIAEDVISGATEEQAEAIRGWLSVNGWEAFCAASSSESESAVLVVFGRGATENDV